MISNFTKNFIFLLVISGSLTTPAIAQISASQFESQIRSQYLSEIHNRIESSLSKRLPSSEYTFEVVLQIDNTSIDIFSKAMKDLEDDGIVSTLLSSPEASASMVRISRMPYSKLRSFIKEAKVNVVFKEDIKKDRWQAILRSLKSSFSRGGPEKFFGSNEFLPPSLEERRAILKRQNDMATIQAEEKAEQRTEILKHGQRKVEIQLTDEIRLAAIEKLKADNIDLAQQINSEDVGTKLARDWPQLLKWLILGSILGALFVLGLTLLGLGYLFSSRALGSRVITAAKESGKAIQSAFAGQAVNQIMKVGIGEDVADRVREIKKVILEKDEEEVEDIEPDMLAELARTIEALKTLVERDIQTSSAQISRLVEGGEQDKVFILLDLLGEELAMLLFDALHGKYQRDLRRYFYLVGPKSNPPPRLLFLLAVEFRTRLTSTNIVTRGSAERRLSHLLLTFSDTELANALKNIETEKSMAILSCLPPPRVAAIMRRVDLATSTHWRKSIVNAVKGEVNLNAADVENVYKIITEPSKVKFEETAAYLKNLMNEFDEIEQEDIIEGAEKYPKLKAAISGLRASMEDLWEQDLTIIMRLIGNVDLKYFAALLCECPDEIAKQIINDMVGRRKELLLDELSVLNLDPKRRKLAVRGNAQVRKTVLDNLADLADEGIVMLPYTRPAPVISRLVV